LHWIKANGHWWRGLAEWARQCARGSALKIILTSGTGYRCGDLSLVPAKRRTAIGAHAAIDARGTEPEPI
jgi:hypothetical protein